MRVLVINPGSTSTKVSVFDDETALFTKSVFHDAPVLLQYRTTNDQLPFRKQVVLDLLAEHNIPIESVDVFVGRGGCAYSQPEGVMVIDRALYCDTRDDKGGSDHPAKLGVMMAYDFALEYGKPAFTLNPTNVDEFDDAARITGIKGVYRRAQSHVLNQKGIARLHASKLGKKYEECSFIVCHIDGGITVAAHRNGRMIDGTEGAGRLLRHDQRGRHSDRTGDRGAPREWQTGEYDCGLCRRQRVGDGAARADGQTEPLRPQRQGAAGGVGAGRAQRGA